MSNIKDHSKTKCIHLFKESLANKEIFFCKKCGIIQHEMKISLKPDGFEYYCESDPFEHLEKMKRIVNDNNEFVDWENETISVYRQNRHILDSIFYLAIKFMDYVIFSNPNLNHQLVAFSSFLLASKFYECDPKLPSLKDFNHQFLHNFSTIDFKNYELICLRYLDYNLDRCTAYNFLELFLKNGIVFEGETSYKNLEKLYSYNMKILNYFIKDQRYFDFNPLQIACAILRLSREEYQIEGWPKNYEKIYKIRGEDFMNCYFVIKTIYISKFSNHKNKAINNSVNSNEKSPKKQKKIKTFNSPNLGCARTIGSQNLKEDFYKSQVRNIPNINKQFTRPDVSLSTLPPLPTNTPNYNFNQSQYNNNDYNVNKNLNHFNHFYLTKSRKPERKSYHNSSDNNELNSTVDEIVENTNFPIHSNIRSARIKSRQMFENFDLNQIHNQNFQNISPFNLDGFVYYNNIFPKQNCPDYSLNSYNNQINRNNFLIRSHTSFNNCNYDRVFIDKFEINRDRQILPPKNFNLLN